MTASSERREVLVSLAIDAALVGFASLAVWL
jgi:hypothetical protein